VAVIRGELVGHASAHAHCGSAIRASAFLERIEPSTGSNARSLPRAAASERTGEDEGRQE
jgi:hypothetical protein